MVPSLDIFKIESGDLRWCEAVANMETAKARIEKLALSSRGNYFIFDQKNRQAHPSECRIRPLVARELIWVEKRAFSRLGLVCVWVGIQIVSTAHRQHN